MYNLQIVLILTRKFLPLLKTNTSPNLELGELLVSLTSSWLSLQDIESNGLRQWSTLTNGNQVTFLDTESWGNVGSQVFVTLLVSVVFWNVVQVVTSDNDGTVHLGGHNCTRQDLTSDGNLTNEWTLLVNVRTLNSGLWGLETQTDLLVPSLGTTVGLGLWVGEDVWLLVDMLV
jgi:hypothetical protein